MHPGSIVPCLVKALVRVAGLSQGRFCGVIAIPRGWAVLPGLDGAVPDV
jgi:hypothetical protein